MIRLVLIVPSELRGSRLDVAVHLLRPEISRSRAGNLIDDGNVTVRDAAGNPARKVKAGLALSGGETIEVDWDPARPLSAAPESIPLDVRYQDDDVLVVDKPAGLVVHPAPGHAGGTLVNALVAYSSSLSSAGGPFRPGIVHRLDKDTSGLLVVAKNDAAHAGLARQLAERTLVREYRALVWGHLQPSGGRIDAPIGRSTRDGKSMAVEGRSQRAAATRYETLEAYAYASWIAVRLETGRTHQIRVHMRHVGHPVVGDPQYGGREKAISGIAPRYRASARALLAMLGRQALHARSVSFVQPTTGKRVAVVAEPPEDIERARDFARNAEA